MVIPSPPPLPQDLFHTLGIFPYRKTDDPYTMKQVPVLESPPHSPPFGLIELYLTMIKLFLQESIVKY